MKQQLPPPLWHCLLYELLHLMQGGTLSLHLFKALHLATFLFLHNLVLYSVALE
jgi:hypothetical protein